MLRALLFVDGRRSPLRFLNPVWVTIDSPNWHFLMHRRRLILSFMLLVMAPFVVISGVALTPISRDLVVPIDRSVLDEQTGKTMEATIPSRPLRIGQEARSMALKPAPDARLVEHAPEGLLPREAENGDRPADVYARPYEIANWQKDLPKLSIMITQAGLSETITAEAYLSLPGEVGFAMSPYAHDAERQMRDIRNRGHEIFLSIVSVVDDEAREDRGPYALDPAELRDTNRKRLLAAMARVTGYVGLVGDLTDHAYRHFDLRDLIESEARSRGVVFVPVIRKDSQSFAHLADHIGSERPPCKFHIPPVRPIEMIAALDGLLPSVKNAGSCTVLIDPSPLALEPLKDWIVKNQSHEFDLIPLSALLRLGGQG